MQHVELYVNQWTVDLGSEGARALSELSIRAESIGLGIGKQLRIFSQ
jgi:1,4-dihydroxy-6-naphthoate synthase